MDNSNYINVADTTEVVNEVVSVEENTDFYNICTKMYTITSVLAFVIIVIFLYRYLKIVFKRRG